MDEKGDFELKFMWQFCNKTINIVLIFVEIVFDGLSKLCVKIEWQIEFLINTVQNCNTLLKLSVGLIVVLENRRQ